MESSRIGPEDVLLGIRENPVIGARFQNTPANLLESAVHSSFELFDKIAPTVFAGKDYYLVLQQGKLSTPISFVWELLPSLINAHRFFGEQLPNGLKTKLRNTIEIRSTLFELECLGFLDDRYEVAYEPMLSDGKRPDFLVQMNTETTIYVECKAQSIAQSTTKYESSMNRAFGLIKKAIDDAKVEVLEKDFLGHYRMEVAPRQSPALRDLKSLSAWCDQLRREDLSTSSFRSKSLDVDFVGNNEPPRSDRLNPKCIRQIPTSGVNISLGNIADSALLAVYPWPKLQKSVLKTQKVLISEARRQLRARPSGSLGLISLKVINSRVLRKAVHNLIEGREFEGIVGILFFRGNEVTIVHRDDQAEVARKIMYPHE